MNKKTIVEWKTEFEKLLNDESNEKFFNNPNNLAFSYSRRKTASPELLEVTRFIDDNDLYIGYKKQPTAPMSLRIYCILNDIHDMESYPKCPMCGKGRSFDSIVRGFRMTCGRRTCFQSHPETNKKRSSTIRENLKSIRRDADTPEETSSGNRSAYRCPWQNDAANVSYPVKIKRLKERMCLKNWGYANPFQVPEIKERIKNRWIELYGVENISQVIETHLRKVEKTGFTYTAPSGEIVKYRGNEHVLPDYLHSEYDECNVYAQPEIGIPYIDGDNILRFWFPDAMVDTTHGKILIDSGDMNSLTPMFTRALRLKHKFIGGLTCGYDTRLYIYVERNIPELYKVTYSPTDNVWKISDIHKSTKHKNGIVSMLSDCGFDKLKMS